jgi:hypothetical protein
MNNKHKLNMSLQQRNEYQVNGYYTNTCYEIAKQVFLTMYNKEDIRNKHDIEIEAIRQMFDYCKSMNMDNKQMNYHVNNYGMKSLYYWFNKYKDTLI